MFLTPDEFVSMIGPQEADSLAGVGLRGQRTLDRAKLQAALDFATGFIRGYIRARYVLPMPDVPEILKGIAQDIAVYRLRLKSGDQSGVTEQVQKRYDDACRQLRDIQAGKLALDAEQIGAPGAISAQTGVYVTGRPSRARDLLEGFPIGDRR